MKKIIILFVLLFLVITTGCSNEPDPIELPTFEELLERNSFKNVLAEHSNMYLYSSSDSDDPAYQSVEEVLYFPGEIRTNYHKKSKDVSSEVYNYTSCIENTFYFISPSLTYSIFEDNEEFSEDYILDFSACVLVGEVYSVNNKIVCKAYEVIESIYGEGDSRFEYTFYYNKDTLLLEKYISIYYDVEKVPIYSCTTTLSYDVEGKFELTAYDMINISGDNIELEIIFNYNTPEQKTYKMLSLPASMVYAVINGNMYIFYADPEYTVEIYDLTPFAGEKTLIVYAKLYE